MIKETFIMTKPEVLCAIDMQHYRWTTPL